MDKYLLRNTTPYDINLGDLRYKIPAGQVRDLLGKNARLDRKLLAKSIVSGSIAARLENGALVEVVRHPDLSPPSKKEISQEPVSFPRQNKSSIVLDVAQLDEQHQNMILTEEDDLLKELQNDDAFMEEMQGAPLVARQEKKEDVEAKDDL